jgi:hypothetical protein
MHPSKSSEKTGTTKQRYTSLHPRFFLPSRLSINDCQSCDSDATSNTAARQNSAINVLLFGECQLANIKLEGGLENEPIST